MTTIAPVIPQNLLAEKSVLGAILVNNDVYPDVAAILQPTDFARLAHQRIYEAIRDLASARTPIEFVTLTDRLTARHDLDECGGPVYLLELTACVPYSINAEFYARIVRDYADKERLRTEANRILASIAESDQPARELIGEAERRIFALSERGTRGDLIDAAALVKEGFPHIERLIEEKRGITGLRTGLTDLDDLTRGLQPA